jgi:hypothetical protein
MSSRLLLILFCTVTCLGCDRIYTLPGHTENNLDAPPDIKMRVGERKEVFWTGLCLIKLVPSYGTVTPEDPGIVSVEYPDDRHAYINAVAVGSVRVHYYWNPTLSDPRNKGFLVTVVPGRER